MNWRDDAFLLSVAKTKKSVLIVEVMTAMHGRRKGLIRDEEVVLLPCCQLDIQCSPSKVNGYGNFEIHCVSGGINTQERASNERYILGAIKTLLTEFLQEAEPNIDVYEKALELIEALREHDLSWPVQYARWEYEFIKSLDLLGGLARCMPAFRDGEMIYVSPRSGRVATRVEAGAWLDRMMPIPGFLLGRKRATVADVVAALDFTAMMFERSLIPNSGLDALPNDRALVREAVSQISELHMPRIREPERDEEDEDYRRRLSTRNQLMV